MMAVLDNWVLGFLAGGQNSTFGQMTVLRVLRVVRVARLARLLHVFKELSMVMTGVIDYFGFQVTDPESKIIFH